MRTLATFIAPALVFAASCGGQPATKAVDGGEQADATDESCTGGSLCGQPASCCAAGNECVENQCVASCTSGVRCGTSNEICCDAGQVCLSETCATPGAACLDSYDCDPGNFCEPTLGQCLPQPVPLTCEHQPSFDALSVQLDWSYESNEIISIPVVGDLDGDGKPEVAVNLTNQDGGGWGGGRIMVLSGEDGAIQLPPIPHAPANGTYGSQGRSTIALGDVDGDAIPDIIYATRHSDGGSLIAAIKGDGTLIWTSHDQAGQPVRMTTTNAAITLANFDADPESEVVVGATILDHTGLVVATGGTGRGTNGSYYGGIAAVADLDGDSIPEIISGRDAFKVSWIAGATPSAAPSVTLELYWQGLTPAGTPVPDGYPAIADLDSNGSPEVVLVASGRLYVLNGQSGLSFCTIDPTDAMCGANASLRTASIALPGGGIGGPPTISDFDADGRVEIGVAGAASYSVYDLNRTGEEVVQPNGDTAPAAGALYVRWSNTTQDDSSNATGSSVFDFQGDGAAEVIYNDECYMRVYSGSDGTVQLELENSSATIHEYPLVVDVDADGNSEIMVVSTGISSCPVGYTPRQGLFVYGDRNDEWVPTRRVWPQHTYHVTNSDSVGNVVQSELDNWTQPGLNNYRQNVQGDGVFNAPDLTLDLSLSLSLCAEGQHRLQGRVSNIGALGVPPGATVTFYQGTDNTGTDLGSATTAQALLPGGSTLVTLTVDATAGGIDYYAEVDGSFAVTVDECDLSNNSAQLTQASCEIVD